MNTTTYCELNESFHTRYGLPKYVSYTGPNAWHRQGRHGYNIIASSDRAWIQYNDGTVKWAKNRYFDPDTAIVDVNEFTFVKLSSVNYYEII